MGFFKSLINKTLFIMKFSKKLLIAALTAMTSGVSAQDLVISKNGESLKFNSSQNTFQKIDAIAYKNLSFDKDRTYSLDRVVHDIRLIHPSLEVSPNYDFYRGLQNPHNPNIWVYMEREQIGGNFTLFAYDSSTQTKTILLEVHNNQDRKTMAYKPIAWSKNSHILYVEGLYLDSAEEHEGIWQLDLNSKKFTKIQEFTQYLSTPILSPKRDKFYATSSVETTLDYLHGENNKLVEFDITNGRTNTLFVTKGNNLTINGFEDKLSNNIVEATSFSNLDYYLPWDFGTILGVSRHGTPAPTGPHTNEGTCSCGGPGGHHNYAAVDFATSLSSDQNVRASQAGVVSFSGISGSLTSGYGRLVIIRHSDGTRTYYAHNKTLLVSQGQSVTKGMIIAKEGTTGGSTGDHIHFEWRAAGGDASSKGSFTGIGEPRQNYRYKSNNQEGTVNNTPTTVNPANNATGTARPVTFTWTTPVNATQFRLQVSTSNTGWNETDGFTSATTTSSTIVVNASLSNTLNFTWIDGVAGSFEGPRPSTSYYYTLRSFDQTTGTSKYTPVKKFTTDQGVLAVSPAPNANVTIPVKLSWTSSVSGGSYRLQISKVGTGWTAANGFTSEANPTSNVPVNYSAAGLLNYTWQSGSAGSNAAPVVGTSYYWTVRVFSSATGTSDYSPVRKFTVTAATARIIQDSEFDSKDVIVYPNPAQNDIQIELLGNDLGKSNIQIIDFQGNIVKSLNTDSSKIYINTENIKDGIYILRVQNNSGIKTTNIIIKK